MNRKLLQILVVPTVSIIFTSGNLVAMNDQTAMGQLTQCLTKCSTKYMEDFKKAKGYLPTSPEKEQAYQVYEQCNNDCHSAYNNQR